MEDLKIDEQNIDALVRSLSKLQDIIAADKAILMDKNADIFRRYMAFIRQGAVAAYFDIIMSINRESISMGHAIGHPIFQTKEAIDNDWNKFALEENPFFKGSKDKEMHMGPRVIVDENMPDFLKKVIHEAIEKKRAEEDEGTLKVKH